MSSRSSDVIAADPSSCSSSCFLPRFPRLFPPSPVLSIALDPVTNRALRKLKRKRMTQEQANTCNNVTASMTKAASNPAHYSRTLCARSLLCCDVRRSSSDLESPTLSSRYNRVMYTPDSNAPLYSQIRLPSHICGPWRTPGHWTSSSLEHRLVEGSMYHIEGVCALPWSTVSWRGLCII